MMAHWWKSPFDEGVGVTVLLGWRLSFAGIEIVMVGSSTSASSSPSEDMSSGTPAKTASVRRKVASEESETHRSAAGELPPEREGWEEDWRYARSRESLSATSRIRIRRPRSR